MATAHQDAQPDMHLPELSWVAQAAQALGRAKPRPVEIIGPWASAKTLTAVQVARALDRPLLILTRGRLEAEGIHDDLCTFAGEIAERTASPRGKCCPTDTMNPADDIVAERMHTLQRLATAAAEGGGMYAVAPIRSFLQFVADPAHLLRDRIVLRVEEEHIMEDLLTRFVKMGYSREVMVEHRGDFSVRGGILDIFPISAELPFRVEFFGDEIESIRRFEPETQRSLEREDGCRHPAAFGKDPPLQPEQGPWPRGAHRVLYPATRLS
jgi:transcription-repair coupling factor (superfamily II helicase)